LEVAPLELHIILLATAGAIVAAVVAEVQVTITDKPLHWQQELVMEHRALALRAKAIAEVGAKVLIIVVVAVALAAQVQTQIVSPTAALV
jgi:hypothetical protein